jgi:hypothetical protein
MHVITRENLGLQDSTRTDKPQADSDFASNYPVPKAKD